MTQRATAAALGVSPSSLSRHPELAKRVAVARKRGDRRERKARSAERMKALRAQGITAAQRPELAGAVPDRYADQRPQPVSHDTRPGGIGASISGTGWRRKAKIAGSGERSRVRAFLVGEASNRDYGDWLRARDQQRDLVQVRLRDDTGIEVDWRVIPRHRARELVEQHGYELLP